MKKIIVLMALLSTGFVHADEYVQGYERHNGTYVQGYERTSPDSSRYNNYSSQGNTNPYTGQQGTQNPNSGYNNGYGSQPNFGGNNLLGGQNQPLGR